MADCGADAGLPPALRILIVDDSRTIRKTAETLLRREGFEASSVGDGFEALAEIFRNPPDIVFVDLMMPRMDGYQTCSMVSTNPRFAHIPIVILSSKEALLDKVKAKCSGAKGYLCKPFCREDILRVLREHFPLRVAAIP